MPEEPQEGENGENLDDPPAFFPYDGSGPNRHANQSELIEVQIEGVFHHENNGKISQFVLLSDGTRRLPIAIGPFEANAIQLIIEGKRPDRPLTHDLIKNILERLDCALDRVVIDDFWNGVYYAKLYLRRGNEESEIDSRSSDAIALAMRFEASVFVAESILDGVEE
jgi:uncharacterized protein